MNDQNFLSQLTDHLEPVKVQNAPIQLAIKLISLILFFIIIFLSMISLRPDLIIQFRNYLFAIEVLNNLFLVFTSLIMIGLYSNPGRQIKIYYKYITVFNLIFLIGLNGYRLSLSPISLFKADYSHLDIICFMTILSYSVFIACLLFYIVKKRVVTNLKLVGAMIGIACAASGSLAISFHCSAPGLIHISVFHYLLPLVTGAVTGMIGGKIFLKW